LDFYKELTPPQQKKAQENRNARAFEETQKNGQAAAYDKFWALYRKSCEQYNPAVAKAAEKEMFEVHMRQNSWGSFPIFANQYPDNIYVKDSAAAIKMQVAVRKNDADAYKKFILAYPQSVFVPIAVDSLYACTLREQNVEEYDYFVRTYPKYAKIDALWTAFYKEFCKSNSSAEFQKSYPTAPKTLYK
jgi:predicted Zn-dependent protease